MQDIRSSNSTVVTGTSDPKNIVYIIIAVSNLGQY